MVRREVWTGTDAFEKHKTSWQRLAEISPDATPFQTYEWQESWYRYFGKSKQPLFLTLQEGSDLVGLMPLILSNGIWKTLRAMGTGVSDYLHPITQPGYESQFAEHFYEFLDEFQGADLIDLHQIGEFHPLDVAAKGAFPHATCLKLDLPGSYDAFLSTLSKSLRYDVRKLDKTLFLSGRAHIEYATPENAAKMLDWLFELHEKRWRKRGLPGAFIGTKIPRFHQDWVSRAIVQNKAWIGLLHLDDQPIGGIYAMAHQGRCYFYQAGFDPAYGSISPGTLLVAQTIRRAIELGYSQFDFLRGDEGYKRRWKPQHEQKNLRYLQGARNTPQAALGRQFNLRGSRIEAALKAKFEK